MLGAGEPPTPGTSNTIASGPSKAARNGATSSMLAPIPLNNSSGGRAFSPGRTPTRSVCPPTSCRRMCTSRLPDIAAGGRVERPGLPIAPARPAPRPPRRGLDPREPMGPPAPLVLRRLLEPGLRVVGPRRAGPEHRLGIAGRIEQALDMAVVGKHERAALAVQLRRLVAALPRRDVI